MNVTENKLPKSQIELAFELSTEEVKPYLEKAARKIANEREFPGFRKGKATYDIIKQNLGEMAIYQRALDLIVVDTYFKEIADRNIETIGYPSIDIVKLAPENPIIYKAVADLMPTVEACDYKAMSVEKKKISVDKDQVDKVVNNLRKFQAKETLEDRPAKAGDKVEVDFDVFQDNVPIEHGKQQKYPLVIGEEKMIPGFEDNLIGMKAEEEKTFGLSFPKDYHNKMLQGKKCEFKVKMNNVYKYELPELNDEFAKSLGMESLEKFNSQIEQNLRDEASQKEEQRVEIEMLEKLVDRSKFSDIPEKLVNHELDKMIGELEANIAREGMVFDDYLKSINKDIGQMKIDFTPQALKRAKLSILTREVAKKENISVSEKELAEEIEKTKKMYADNPEIIKNLETEGYKQYIENVLANRKVIEVLKAYIIK